MTTGPALLDTDTLSEIIKGRDAATQRQAQEHLTRNRCFRFSIITRYEILRLVLVTNNLSHFRRIEGLVAESWRSLPGG